MTPEEIESLLNARADRNEKAISDAIIKLENRVIDLSAQIEVKSDGTIVGPSRSLAQSRAMLKETSVAFEKIYLKAVDSTHDYSDIDKLVQDYLGVTYNGVTATTLTALIANDRGFHESLSSQTQDDLNATLIDHVVNGRSKNDLINSMRNILTGIEGVGGRAMSSYAKTISQDSLMEYYSTANLMSADKAGVTKFKYFGSLIKDSRQWCADHINQTFTREQIDAFDDDKWQGKKPGSTIKNRGGYGCRHSWLPIIN